MAYKKEQLTWELLGKKLEQAKRALAEAGNTYPIINANATSGFRFTAEQSIDVKHLEFITSFQKKGWKSKSEFLESIPRQLDNALQEVTAKFEDYFLKRQSNAKRYAVSGAYDSLCHAFVALRKELEYSIALLQAAGDHNQSKKSQKSYQSGRQDQVDRLLETINHFIEQITLKAHELSERAKEMDTVHIGEVSVIDAMKHIRQAYEDDYTQNYGQGCFSGLSMFFKKTVGRQSSRNSELSFLEEVAKQGNQNACLAALFLVRDKISHETFGNGSLLRLRIDNLLFTQLGNDFANQKNQYMQHIRLIDQHEVTIPNSLSDYFQKPNEETSLLY